MIGVCYRSGAELLYSLTSLLISLWSGYAYGLSPMLAKASLAWPDRFFLLYSDGISNIKEKKRSGHARLGKGKAGLP